MIDPAFALLRYAMDDDIYLQYMDDVKAYRASQKAAGGFYNRLSALLDDTSKGLLDDFLNEKMIADVQETDAAFMTGLAFGLQLMRLS